MPFIHNYLTLTTNGSLYYHLWVGCIGAFFHSGHGFGVRFWIVHRGQGR